MSIGPQHPITANCFCFEPSGNQVHLRVRLQFCSKVPSALVLKANSSEVQFKPSRCHAPYYRPLQGILPMEREDCTVGGVAPTMNEHIPYETQERQERIEVRAQPGDPVQRNDQTPEMRSTGVCFCLVVKWPGTGVQSEITKHLKACVSFQVRLETATHGVNNLKVVVSTNINVC